MKTLIVYHSEHHGNTKKLLDAIAKEGNVTLLDASSGAGMDCGEYDLIGFASGIYYQKFHKNVVSRKKGVLPLYLRCEAGQLCGRHCTGCGPQRGAVGWELCLPWV